MQWMLESMMVLDSAPSVIGSYLNVASLYLRGQATLADLTDARVACWSCIKDRDCAFHIPEVCAVRAAIGILWPKEGWSFDTVWHFAQFYLEADGDPTVLSQNLHKVISA